MKVVFALYTNNEDSDIHPIFGRCSWFGIYDRSTKALVYIKNKISPNEESFTCPDADSLLSLGLQSAVAGSFSPKTAERLLRNKVRLVIPNNACKFKDLLAAMK